MTGKQGYSRVTYDWRTLIVVTLVLLAILLGGGGSPSPEPELALELLFGLAALAWLWTGRERPRARDSLLLAVALLVLLLPAVQLVPLPPALWTALPGRGAEREALALVGAGDSWQPLTTSSPRTLAGLLALIPPVLLMLMVAALRPERRAWVVAAIAAMALLTALFGAVQLAGGHAAPRLYAQSHSFGVTGFQANRNAAADVLLIGIVALGVLGADASGHAPRLTRPLTGWWLVGASAVLVLAAILTGSRMGIALLPLALLAQWLLLRPHLGSVRGKSLPAIAAGAIALVLAAVFALRDNTALKAVAQRFDATRDARLDLWSDTLFAIRQYWPFGSGLGTFVPTFIAAERLEAVDPTIPNRAHNDYLEFALEGGAVGLALLLVVVVLVVTMAARAWRRRPQDRAQVILAIATLAIVAAHSVVDYPLRSMALACLSAVGVGLLAMPPGQSGEGGVPSPDPSRGEG